MIPKEYICIYPKNEMATEVLREYKETKHVTSWSLTPCPPINPKVDPDPSYELRITYFDRMDGSERGK